MVKSVEINLIGTADSFNYINEVDKYKNKNEYKVNLILEKFGDEFNKLNELSEKLIKEKLKEIDKEVSILKNYKDKYIYNTNEKTGYVIINAKLKEKYKYNGETIINKSPSVFDENNEIIEEKELKEIREGYKINVRVELIPYYFERNNIVGVTLRLKAIKILERTSSNTSNNYGFGENDYIKAKENLDIKYNKNINNKKEEDIFIDVGDIPF